MLSALGPRLPEQPTALQRDDSEISHTRAANRAATVTPFLFLTPANPKQTFPASPTNACLESFVFAEFFRKTGKTTPAFARACFCELCLGSAEFRQRDVACLWSAAERRMASRMAIIRWLLDSDPSIRWQVMRDLGHAPGEAVTAERSRIASEGWGARLLDLQTPDGHWGDDQEHGWMTTTSMLALLKDLGVAPTDEKVSRAIGLVRERITWWQLDGRPFFDGETEACLNGRILAAGAYFGAASDRLVDRLLDEQLEDGGWNCEAPPSKRSSFHSTICVLEGLLAYEQTQDATSAVTQARIRAQDYLLERRMFRSLTSGEVIDRRWTRFSFPTTWHYDVLRGLDYLRSAEVQPDERMAEAVELVEKRSHQNGRWPLNSLHSDRIPFDMEDGVGRARRWNTLRAFRVLDWHANGTSETAARRPAGALGAE